MQTYLSFTIYANGQRTTGIICNNIRVITNVITETLVMLIRADKVADKISVYIYIYVCTYVQEGGCLLN